MIVLAAHAFYLLAFTVGSAWDLLTTEVPDSISLLAVTVGVVSHAIIFFQTGDPGPLIWSVAAGTLFGIYGWAMYFTGSWGGADAFAITALGFSSAVSLSGSNFIHLFDLFVNVMLAGFLYALFFSLHKAYRMEGFMDLFRSKIEADRKRITVETAVATVSSVLLGLYFEISFLFYLFSLVGMVFLYRFLKLIEDHAMTQQVDISEVDPGEVIVEGGKDPRIKGVTEDEIQEISGQVTVKKGIMFVPVFPVALFITDMQLFGIELLVNLVSL